MRRESWYESCLIAWSFQVSLLWCFFSGIHEHGDKRIQYMQFLGWIPSTFTCIHCLWQLWVSVGFPFDTLKLNTENEIEGSWGVTSSCFTKSYNAHMFFDNSLCSLMILCFCGGSVSWFMPCDLPMWGSAATSQRHEVGTLFNGGWHGFEFYDKVTFVIVIIILLPS